MRLLRILLMGVKMNLIEKIVRDKIKYARDYNIDPTYVYLGKIEYYIIKEYFMEYLKFSADIKIEENKEIIFQMEIIQVLNKDTFLKFGL